MTQATVRAAVTSFLAAQSFTNVPYVLPAWPSEFDGALWGPAEFGTWQALLAVHLSDSDETRVAIDGGQGVKRREHSLGLLIYYQYAKPEFPPSNQPYNTAWVDGLDTVLDQVMAAIRTDQTAGTGNLGAVWQWGQEDNDLKLTRDLPRDTGGQIISYNRIDIHLTEFITG